MNSTNFITALDLAMSQNKPVEAITYFNLEIASNPNNFAAWNERGMCKIYAGMETGDKELIAQGKDDIRKSVELAKQEGAHYSVAQTNLDWINLIEF